VNEGGRGKEALGGFFALETGAYQKFRISNREKAGNVYQVQGKGVLSSWPGKNKG